MGSIAATELKTAPVSFAIVDLIMLPPKCLDNFESGRRKRLSAEPRYGLS
jgi:hypothetical protein